MRERLFDLVWPHLVGKDPESPEQTCVTEIPYIDLLEHHLDLNENDQRESIRSVEARLVALLTLSSMLSVATVAGMTWAFALSTNQELPKSPSLLATIFVFYIAMQLWRTLWCTIGGLSRRGYKKSGTDTLVARTNEGCKEYRTRIGLERLNNLEYNRWVINQKVSEMDVAHTAYRNALIGAIALMMLILFVAVIRLL